MARVKYLHYLVAWLGDLVVSNRGYAIDVLTLDIESKKRGLNNVSTARKYPRFPQYNSFESVRHLVLVTGKEQTKKARRHSVSEAKRGK